MPRLSAFYLFRLIWSSEILDAFVVNYICLSIGQACFVQHCTGLTNQPLFEAAPIMLQGLSVAPHLMEVSRVSKPSPHHHK